MKRWIIATVFLLFQATAQASEPARAESGPSWTRAARSARLPADAVASGAEPDTHICRAEVGGELVPGELVGRRCRAIHADSVHDVIGAFEVLTAPGEVGWREVRGRSRDNLSGAIMAGKEGRFDLYVCRVRTAEGIRVGRAEQHLIRCLTVEGEQIGRHGRPFELLVDFSRDAGVSLRGDGGDRLRPDCDPSRAVARPAVLWPPDGELSEPVRVEGVANARIVRVESNECPERAGRGPAPASIARDRESVRLRRERGADGRGRVFRVHFEAPGCGAGWVDVCVPIAKGTQCAAGKGSGNGARFLPCEQRSVGELERP